MVEAARDHSKSFTFSYTWPLFNLQRFHQRGAANKADEGPETIALISYAEDQAKKNLARIRKAIEGSVELRWLLPKSKAYVWDAGMLNCSNDSTIETFGFGSSVRGGHYHRIIVDDPTKDHVTMSLAEQENFFFGVILPALRRGGQLVVTGNPVAKQDLLHKLEENKEFKFFKYPAFNESGQPLWPEQWDTDGLRAKQRMMPPHIWAREFMLKRISAADAKFREEWIKYYEVAPKNLYKVMTIDPAISPGGDALAAVTSGTDNRDNTYILDRFAYRGEMKAGISKLIDMMVAQQPDRIGFETYAFQKMYKVWLEDEIKARGMYFCIEEVGRDSSKSKAMRIEALQPKLAQGKLFFKREHYPMVDQLLLWDPLSKTNDDDEIDALAWQVGMWRSHPDEITATNDPLPGTFDAIAKAIIYGGRDKNYLSRLFEDMH